MKFLLKSFLFSFILGLPLLSPLTIFAEAPSNGIWTPVGNMTTRRLSFTSTLLQDGKVLVAGGRPSNSEPLIDYTELYDPITKTWTKTGNLNTPRMRFNGIYDYMVTLQNGKALIAGGVDANFTTSYASSEIYNPSTGMWSYTGNLNTPRRDMSLILLNDGRVLTAGGSTGGVPGTILDTSELYDPTTGIWTYTTNNLGEVRNAPTMIKLQDGKILLFGGHTYDHCISNVEIFNPSTNMWSSLGTMPFGEVFSTATLLADGRVFVAGESCSNAANSAIYDPGTNTWSSTIPFPIKPAVKSFLLDNGTVLLRSGSTDAGGNPGTIAPVNEVYNPAINSWNITQLPLGGNNGSIYTQLKNGTILRAGGWDCDPSNPNCTLASAELFTSTNLSVPLLKQTDSLWGTQVYDSADKWAPQHPTIGDWGCAMTSATMVLQYYGINKLPDNTSLDPGTLNTWLKNQQDGYVNDGWVNWLAIARLTKLGKNNNPSFTYDALEYKNATADATQLTKDITNLQPDILEEPGHFIVAKGINGSTFDINDPYYNRSDLTQGYSNSFLSLGRYVPSHTDLSYIMLTVNPNINITAQTASGSAIGESFIQQPYNDPLNPGTSGGQPIIVSSSSTQTYQLNTYLYDKDGNVNLTSKPGTVGPNTNDTFTISFNQQNASASAAKRIVTFQNLLDDINENKNLQQINGNVATALVAIANTAKDSYDKGNKSIAKIKLNAFEGLLYVFRSRGISETAFQILLYDAEFLKAAL